MPILTTYIVIGTIIILLIAVFMIFIVHRMISNERLVMRQEEEYENLSFVEINDVIDSVIIEITMKKYNLYYRLKEITIIPDMEKEALEMTTEIVKAFSDKIIRQIMRYYTKEYFYAKVTREVQMFLVEYTDKHKPPTK